MTVIYKDVKTLTEIGTVTGQQTKSLVMYDTSTGEATGLDVEVLIGMDASISEITAQVEALDAGKVDKTQSVLAGAGLTGGGTLAGDVTLNVNTYNGLDSTSTTRPLSAAQGKALDGAKENIADLKAVFPASVYYKRMAALGATIDKTALLKVYMETMSRQANTQIMYIPQVGMVERTSGVNKYAARLGDMTVNDNDAIQATEATQPFVGGYIAPNEMRCLKFTFGQTQTGQVTFSSAKNFLSTDSWTLIVRMKINRQETGLANILMVGNGWVWIGGKTINLNNGSTTFMSANYTFDVGKTHTIEYQYSNGVGLIKVNNRQLVTTCSSSAMSFSKISNYTGSTFDGNLYSFHLSNTRASEIEGTQAHTFLQSMFPDMESVTIGNQVWATSNFDGIVAGDGTVIPEVQSAATAADAINIYNATYAATTGTPAVKDLAATKAAAMWSHYNNLAANGAVYGKLYNWYAVHLFDLYPPVKGWRVPSKLDFDQLVAVNGGSTVAGGKLKAKFGGFNNAFSSNESGFSAVAGGQRDVTGTFIGLGTYGLFSSSTLFSASAYNRLYTAASDVISSMAGGEFARMYSLRLLRNEPAGLNELSYTSGLFTTDITSVAKQIPISFGRTVDYIRIKSENSLTAIEAKLHNAAGTAVATLITGKTIGAGETKMFAVTSDWVSLLQDGTIRVTAAGNSSAAVGMEIEVLTHKGVLS